MAIFPTGGGYNTLELSSGELQNDSFPIWGGVEHPETAIWGSQNGKIPVRGGYNTQNLSSGDPRMTEIPSGGGKTPRNSHPEIPEWQKSHQWGVRYPETVIWGSPE